MKILLTGGAGYVGSACSPLAAPSRPRSDRLRQPVGGKRRGRPRRGRPVDRRRHRRDGPPGPGAQGAPASKP